MYWLATVNSDSYWSRATFTEQGVRVCTTDFSHIFTVQNMEGIHDNHRQERGGLRLL